DDGEPPEDEPLVDWACRYALHRASDALDGILRNYPIAWLGKAMRVNVFGAGRYLRAPDDALSRRAAEAMQTAGAARDRLTAQMYLPNFPSSPSAQMESALALMTQSKPLRRRLKAEGHEPSAAQTHAMWLAALRSARVLDDDESDLLARVRAAVLEVISVDEFDAPPRAPGVS
ncbi:MAG: acyl-CoA dehydrogenase domain-containing protein, partial [bacterium]